MGNRVVLTVETRPDDNGRQRFVADWIDPGTGRTRGQYFYAILADQVAGWKRSGYIVTIRERFE